MKNKKIECSKVCFFVNPVGKSDSIKSEMVTVKHEIFTYEPGVKKEVL